MLKRILFVDDDPCQRYLLAFYLTSSAYQVTTVASAQAALSALGQFTPDLLITDIVMPQMDGFQLVETIQASDSAGQFPIMFVSSLNNLGNRVQVYNKGGDYFLPKPWCREELVAAVESLLRPLSSALPTIPGDV